MTDEQRHVRRTLNFLIRPALVAAIGLTVYGNLAQAQPSVGGWVSHGWAPALYLVLVEILVRKAVGGGWFAPVLGGFLLLASVAGVVSFTSLTHAAVRWGWEPGEAWLFPIIVDLTAVLLTMASMGVGARLRELAEPEPAAEPETEPEPVDPSKGGRREQPGSVRYERKIRRDARAAGVLPGRTTTADRIVLEFGTDPAAWPGPKAIADQLSVGRSTASEARTKALKLVRGVEPGEALTRVSSSAPNRTDLAEQAEPGARS